MIHPGSEPPANRRLLIGVLVALGLHAAAAIALSHASPDPHTTENISLVEVDTEEPPSPPPPPPPPPPEAPPEPDVKEEPPPEPEAEPEKPESPPPPPPEAEKPAPPPAPVVMPVSDVSDSTFSEEGDWEISNVVDNPDAVGPMIVGAENVVAPPPPPPAPPPPPPPPLRPRGSTGEGTIGGTGEGTGGPRAASFRPATDVSRGPEIVEEIRAEYPDEARREGIQGAVRLLVSIRKDGSVYRVRVLDDPGGGLGDAAKKALERFRFSPALGPGGDPVDYQINYTYRFELDS